MVMEETIDYYGKWVLDLGNDKYYFGSIINIIVDFRTKSLKYLWGCMDST